MADIVDKIGKYFAEQEAHLRQVYALAATQLPPGNTRGVHGGEALSHRRRTEQSASELASNHASNARHSVSLLRHRLSQQNVHTADAHSAVADARVSLSMHPAQPALASATKAAATANPVVVVVPPLALPPQSSTRQHAAGPRKFENPWSEDELASWRSARSSSAPAAAAEPQKGTGYGRTTIADATRPEVMSSDDDNNNSINNNEDESSHYSRRSSNECSVPTPQAASPLPLPVNNSSTSTKTKTKKKTKKLTRRRSSKAEANVPSAEQLKRGNDAKVAAALVLAQERARWIHAERELQRKSEELARMDETRRVQDEMDKIEAIRLKSKQFALRLRPSTSPHSSDASSLSSLCSSRTERSFTPGPASVNSVSVGTTAEHIVFAPRDSDSNILTTTRKPTFLDTTERQLRDRMMLELCVREMSLEVQRSKSQALNRKRLQFAAHDARARASQQRVATLEATCTTLATELASVHDQLEAVQSQRRALEDASQKARAQRQRDAERQLRARVRAEEWTRLTDDERARSEVAADARVRAGQRVVSRFKKRLSAHLCENQSTSSRASRSSNNNNIDDNDDDAELHRILGLPTMMSRPTPTTTLLLAPELAEFEEDGLLGEYMSDSRGNDGHETVLQQATAPATTQLISVSNSGSNHDVTSEGCESHTTEPREISEEAAACDPEVNGAPLVPQGQGEFTWRVPRMSDRALFDRVLRFDIPSP